MRAAMLAGGCAALVGLSACGGQSDQDRVKEVATQLATANPKVCDRVSGTFLKQVGGSRDACRKGAKASKAPNAKVGNVKVDGDRATAELSQGGTKATISFVKDGKDWKVNGAR